MALAKHHEEIEERRVTNTSDRYDAMLADFLGQLPPILPHSGEVYLLRGGRRMEDIEVCEVGETLNLAVESKQGSAPVELELLNDSGRRALKPRANGQVSIPFQSDGCWRIQAASGGYIKHYTIHAVEPLRGEELPDFAKLIQSLT